MLLICILEVPGFSVMARILTILIGFVGFFQSAHTYIDSVSSTIIITSFHILCTSLFLLFLLYALYFSFYFRVQSLYVPCCSFCPQYYMFPGHVSLIHICLTYWLLSFSSKMTNVIPVNCSEFMDIYIEHNCLTNTSQYFESRVYFHIHVTGCHFE